jgi:hypothetical protein
MDMKKILLALWMIALCAGATNVVEVAAVSTKTGEVLHSMKLPVPPQQDGMCVVGDSVIINSGNRLFCLSGAKN